MIYPLLPVYNEEQNLDRLFERFQKGIDRSGQEFTLVAYNDGSRDSSLPILQKWAGKLPLHIIGKEENMGLGFALRSLFLHALSDSQSDDDIFVVLDSDNSHNPEHLFQMITMIRNGYDLVIASRYLTDSRVVGVPVFRQFLSYGASILMRVLFPIKGVKDYTCGYRAYRAGFIRRTFETYGDATITENGFACMAELLIKMKYLNVLAVEIPLILRYDFKGGASKMHLSKTIKKTLRLLYNLKKSPKQLPNA